jgi:hypothetical protein
MTKRDTRAGLGAIGVGAAACAACCAGPIVGFLTAIGVASVLGAAMFGMVGLLAVLAVAAVAWRRRGANRRNACSATFAVPIDDPRFEARR